ncbi:hypothetical protein RUM44_000902 [Polyplax serrata]|uniref:RING-type domain-containing protein n=1 Tax=Polyplax serrata TaxID=468196 RepID=A0ABR1B6C6_POLSC
MMFEELDHEDLWPSQGKNKSAEAKKATATRTKTTANNKMPKIQIFSSPTRDDETATKKNKPKGPARKKNTSGPLEPKADATENSTTQKPKPRAKSKQVPGKENHEPPTTGKGTIDTEAKRGNARAGTRRVGANKENLVAAEDKEKSKTVRKRQKKAPIEEQVPTGEGKDGSKKVSNGSNASKSRSSLVKDFQINQDLALLESMFPNIDPAFLKAQYTKKKRSLEETINLISVRKTANDTVTRQCETDKMAIDRIQQKYTREFNVAAYIKTIPDPWNYFLNTDQYNSLRYAEQSFLYLKTKFPMYYVQTVKEELVKCEYSLYRTKKELAKTRNKYLYKTRMSSRMKAVPTVMNEVKFDVQFLQEVAFIEHEEEIIEKLKEIETAKFAKFKQVLNVDVQVWCRSCSNRNLTWENSTFCKDNHPICKECINRHVMREINDDNFVFKCPIRCHQILTLDLIQDLLCPKLLAVVTRKNQFDELRDVGFGNVIHCPSCYYIQVTPTPHQTHFHCLNPSCMRVSCRKCNRCNHDPLACDEVEEGQMPEDKFDVSPALCYNCNRELVKEENTNKLHCQCGTVMCYLCRQPYANCHHNIFSSVDLGEEYFNTSGSESTTIGDSNRYLHDISASESDTTAGSEEQILQYVESLEF